MITVDVQPEGKRKVILTFEDKENDIGVVEVIKCIAHYIKLLCDEHGLKPEDLAVSSKDKVSVLEPNDLDS